MADKTPVGFDVDEAWRGIRQNTARDIPGGGEAGHTSMDAAMRGFVDEEQVLRESGRLAPRPADPSDLIDRVMEQWREDVDPYYQQDVEAAQARGDSLIGAAGAYGDELRGSESYGALQGTSDELLGLYEAGGLTDVTRAQLESNRRNADAFVRSNREAALQDLAERGMAGGGAEVAALMGDRSAAADRMNANDLDAAAFGQKSAMEALMDHRDVNSELMGYDQSAAAEMLAAQTSAAEGNYDVSEKLTDAGMGFLTGLHKTSVDAGREAFAVGAANAPGVAEGVAKITGDTISAGVDKGTGVLTGGAGNTDLIDPSGSGATPSDPTSVPGYNPSGEAGAFASGGTAAVDTVLNNLPGGGGGDQGGGGAPAGGGGTGGGDAPIYNPNDVGWGGNGTPDLDDEAGYG